MPQFSIFGLEFKNVIAMFEISAHKFFLLQTVRPKMPYLNIFGPDF